MPYVPPLMTGMAVARGLISPMIGTKMVPAVNATCMALCQYLSLLPITTTSNVVVGPGAGTTMGKIIGCVPSGMSTMMMAGAVIQGLIGKDMKKLFDAVSFGACMTLLTTGMTQGVVIGGGPGVGQGKVLNMLPPVMQGLIMANLAGSLIMGTKTVNVAFAIAFGVCMHIMMAGTVMQTCIGAFTPPPVGPVPIPAAPGIGRLI